MFSHLPRPAHRDYAKPPIRLVVCQLRFPAVLALGVQDGIIPFQEATRRRYPIFGTQEQVTLALGGSERPVTRIGAWRFADLGNAWAVSLTTDSVALETSDYAGIADFTERWLEVVSNLKELIAPAQQIRLGLRYINELRPRVASSREWIRWVNPALVGPFATDLVDAGLAQAVTEALFFSTSVGHGALMRYGALPGGSTVPGPVADQPFFLLDYDVFDPQPRAFDVGNVAATTRTINAEIYRVFRWSITPAFEDFMEPLNG